MKQFSTAELEAKILAGETVTAEALATAKQHGEATARISELTRQREANETLESNRAECELRQKPIKSKLKAIASDTVLQDIQDKITNLVSQYHTKVKDHNNDVIQLRGEIEDVKGFAKHPSFIEVHALPTGEAMFDEYQVNHVSDWENNLRRIFESAIVSTKSGGAQ
jgi:hypothetical protein